jgi:spermidine/putrescine transport system substrate-binding protein
MRIELDRRRFGQFVGAAAAATLVSSAMVPGLARAAGETITVLNWQGYGTDEEWALKAFTQKTGIKVVHDYFNSESEMVTKLQTNPGAYDVVLVNSARTSQLGADLLDPIDLVKIPNARDLTPALKNHPNFMIGGKPYGCVWVWGITGLGVRMGKVAQGASLAVLTDPVFVNRAAMNDDPIVAIGIGALMSGQDINAPKDLKRVGEKLRDIKKNIRLLWQSEDEWNKAFAADQFDVSVFWSGAAIRSRQNSKLPVEFIMPREGALGWIDTLTIPKTSKNKDAALAFINYMIDPDFYYEWSTKIGAPASANAAAMAKLSDDDLNKVVHKAEYLGKLQIHGPLSDATRAAFVDLWEETKAFYAK